MVGCIASNEASTEQHNNGASRESHRWTVKYAVWSIQYGVSQATTDILLYFTAYCIPISKRIVILGVPLDTLSHSEVQKKLKAMLKGTTQNHIATPNNEILLLARTHTALHRILQKTTLNLPDSTGLKLAAWITKQPVPIRITGADTAEALLLSLNETTPVFLLGAAEGIAAKAASAMKERNPKLRIVGTYSGSPKEEDVNAICEYINRVQPHLLLVAYGAPSQELWIAKHLDQLPSVRVAMGIGGTFDYWAGKRKRAPQWLRKLGLEWLWRLIIEPSRIGRIWNAVVVFPLIVLLKEKTKD